MSMLGVEYIKNGRITIMRLFKQDCPDNVHCLDRINKGAKTNQFLFNFQFIEPQNAKSETFTKSL